MEKKKQIIKQLKYAIKLLKEISKEHKSGNYFRFGRFAYIVQSNEIIRLSNLLKKYN